jgi:hypothetical protein
MPKENINDTTQDAWRLEVSWKADERPGGTSGHVQVASVNSNRRFPGWRVTLDADGLDRTIAALSKARRQAYPAPDRDDLLEAAWGLICNASNRTIDQGGPVDASPGWQEAAVRWRDGYHQYLRACQKSVHER